MKKNLNIFTKVIDYKTYHKLKEKKRRSRNKPPSVNPKHTKHLTDNVSILLSPKMGCTSQGLTVSSIPLPKVRRLTQICHQTLRIHHPEIKGVSFLSGCRLFQNLAKHKWPITEGGLSSQGNTQIANYLPYAK